MTHRVTAGESVQFHFLALQLDGVTPYTGLVPADFTILLFQNLTQSAETVTVSEIGTTGVYNFSFTPPSAGYWHANLQVIPTGDWFQDDVHVLNAGEIQGAEAQMNTAYEDSTSVLYMEVWLDRNGQSIVSGLVSCSVSLYDQVGNLLFTETSSSPKADGRFSLTRSVTLLGDRPYNATVTVTDALGAVTTFQAFTTIG